jgi:O-antigen/teichoic acid export membrane protein
LLAAVFLINERRNISVRSVSGHLMRDMLSYGFPMMLYGATGIVMAYFGRIALNASTNLATLGVYSFFLMITLQVSGLWGSINRAWTPDIFSLLRDHREQALEKVRRFTFMASFLYLCTLLIFIFVGEWFLFRLVLKQIYLDNIHILYILLLGPVFIGIYTASYPLFYYENKTTLILIISFIISPINILTTLVLVRFFSQNGAAESYLLTSALTTILYLFVFRKIGNVPAGIIRVTILLSLLGCLSVWALLQKSQTLFYISNIIGLLGIYRMGMLSSEISLYLNRLRKVGIFPR